MKRLILIFVFLFSPFLVVHAQSTVTFNVDLKAMMRDSTFIPGQDFVQVNGNLYPFGQNRAIKLSDETPMDSVFTAEVRFSRRFENERLNYNFEIVKPNEIIGESRNRSIILRNKDIILPPISFNSFIQ